MDQKDYYKILGISRLATERQIKDAFRTKSKETHPDNQNGNADLFRDVYEAYKVLSDPVKRMRYDNDEKDITERTAEELRKQAEATAIFEIQNMVVQLLFESGDDRIFQSDVPATMKGIAKLNLSEWTKTVANSRKKVSRLRRLRSKFKTKGQVKENIVEVGLNRQIQLERAVVLDGLHKTTIFKKMLELLDEYDFEIDSAPKAIT